MPFIFANINDRSALVQGEAFFDLATVSAGAVSTDAMEAIQNSDLLHHYAGQLDDYEPSGIIADGCDEVHSTLLAQRAQIHLPSTKSASKGGAYNFPFVVHSWTSHQSSWTIGNGHRQRSATAIGSNHVGGCPDVSREVLSTAGLHWMKRRRLLVSSVN